jgi:hypothetical protein
MYSRGSSAGSMIVGAATRVNRRCASMKPIARCPDQ